MIYFISNQYIESEKFTCIDNIQIVCDYLESVDVFTLDTETTGLDPRLSDILLIQVGDDEVQFVIDVRLQDFQAIFKYLIDETKCKILVNAKFDYKQLLVKYNIRVNNMFDVLTVDRILYNGLMGVKEESMYKKEHGYGRFSLAGLAKKYLNIRMSKEERNSFIGHKGDFTENQILYAAGDIDVPYIIKKKQDQQLELYSLSTLAYEVENPVIAAFAEMELNGLYLNTDKWRVLIEQNIKKLQEISDKLDQIIVSDEGLYQRFGRAQQLGIFAGTDGRKCVIKWSSPKQKITLLRSLGFDLWVKDKTTREMKESVDINVLTKYKDQHPLIPLMIEYGETSKNVSSYGEKFLKHINETTNRVHTEIFPIKDTGRTGSGNPNLQNIPSDTAYRNCFEAQYPNRTFIVADYSNMELRIIAEKSKEQTLIVAFLNNEDVHSSMAMMIQKVVYKKDVIVSKYENEQLRTESKTITFLIAFGGSAYKLKDQLSITMEEAQQLIDAYFRAFPKLKEFTEGLQNFGIQKGYIRTYKPYSRLRWFPQKAEYDNLKRIYEKTEYQFKRMMTIRGDIMRASSNTPVQGSAADIMKIACKKVLDYLVWFSDELSINDFNNPDRPLLCMQIHDEMIIECNEEHAEQIAKQVGIIMENAGKGVMEIIPMIAEPNITKVWKK